MKYVVSVLCGVVLSIQMLQAMDKRERANPETRITLRNSSTIQDNNPITTNTPTNEVIKGPSHNILQVVSDSASNLHNVVEHSVLSALGYNYNEWRDLYQEDGYSPTEWRNIYNGKRRVKTNFSLQEWNSIYESSSTLRKNHGYAFHRNEWKDIFYAISCAEVKKTISDSINIEFANIYTSVNNNFNNLDNALKIEKIQATHNKEKEIDALKQKREIDALKQKMKIHELSKQNEIRALRDENEIKTLRDEIERQKATFEERTKANLEKTELQHRINTLESNQLSTCIGAENISTSQYYLTQHTADTQSTLNLIWEYLTEQKTSLNRTILQQLRNATNQNGIIGHNEIQSIFRNIICDR